MSPRVAVDSISLSWRLSEISECEGAVSSRPLDFRMRAILLPSLQMRDLNLIIMLVAGSFFTESCMTIGAMIAPFALASLRLTSLLSGLASTDSCATWCAARHSASCGSFLSARSFFGMVIVNHSPLADLTSMTFLSTLETSRFSASSAALTSAWNGSTLLREHSILWMSSRASSSSSIECTSMGMMWPSHWCAIALKVSMDAVSERPGRMCSSAAETGIDSPAERSTLRGAPCGGAVTGAMPMGAVGTGAAAAGMVIGRHGWSCEVRS